jgi:hypothetical protein
MLTLYSHQNKQSQETNMEKEDINKAIAYLADKVSKYHERLLAAERDLERHLKDTATHCNGDCECKNPKT